MTTLEKVAIAISGAPYVTKNSLKKARAAIEALKNPPQMMVDLAFVYDMYEPPDTENWNAMLDAILNEKES